VVVTGQGRNFRRVKGIHAAEDPRDLNVAYKSLSHSYDAGG
jgi:hypothetical protein